MLVQLLLKYGADVNHQDLQGWSVSQTVSKMIWAILDPAKYF